MEVIAALCRVGVEFFTSEIHRWLACFSADVMKVLENRFILYGVYSLERKWADVIHFWVDRK